MESRKTKSCDIQQLTTLLMTIIVIMSCFVSEITGLSVTVNDEECVYEYVLYEGTTVSGNFVVLDPDYYWIHRAGNTPIDFTATSPGDNVVHSVKGSSGDKFEFKAPRRGMYKFCFHNPTSTPETVSFYIHVGHILSEHDLAKDEHLDPINVKISKLKEALESVTTEQKYLKARDARHRHTNENTRKQVVFYTVGEYLMLVLASGLQVIYIRQLFSKTIAYCRV